MVRCWPHQRVLRDHPREYGENTASWVYTRQCPGSSPRIRGECSVEMRLPRALGIIPANTGRISEPAAPISHHTDHPREYGENKPWLPTPEQARGSSPRIRGEFDLVQVNIGLVGIIPANTGRIRLSRYWFPAHPDHPREYGENMRERMPLMVSTGSSPRIRGEYAQDHGR